MSRCQICYSNDKRKLTELCSNMDIMGPFFKKVKSDIVACTKCGNVYVDIDVEQEAFTKYYSSDYSKSLSYIEVFGEKNALVYYENIYKRISKYIGKDAKILEIGGGIGELSEFLKNKGYEDITILEPSKRCIEMCKEKGFKTLYSDAMATIDEERGKYDFIIINHTLEHILSFDNILKVSYDMLKDDGGIYIEVPDAEKYTEVDFVPYWFFTYEHIAHFSLNSFDNIAAAFGFIVKEKKSYLKCNSYNVMYAVFQKSNNCGELKYLPEVEQYVSKYINYCDGRLKPIIDELEKTKEPLILWGVGTSTAQLLNGNFDNCNVVRLIDSNPYRQNITYTVGGKSFKIESPDTISDMESTILILPLMYDTSIRTQIKHMGLKNKVKSLISEYRS